MSTLTIRLDDQLDGQLSRLAERSHRTKSDLVREMLRREAALEELRQTRGLLKPYAERAGYLSDEDFSAIFRESLHRYQRLVERPILAWPMRETA